jgi:hypothetical protein
VFLALTGHAAEETGQPGKRRGRRRGGGKDTANEDAGAKGAGSKDTVRARS